MTEQEVISVLKYIYKKCDTENCKYKGQCDSCYEAVEMAISAMEKQMKLKLLGFTEEVIRNYKIFEDECISKGMSFKDILEARDRQINGGWIPCSERLPEKSTRVLVTQDFDGYKNVTDANYFDNLSGKNFWSNNKMNNVVAWKPLSEPYKAN